MRTAKSMPVPHIAVPSKSPVSGQVKSPPEEAENSRGFFFLSTYILRIQGAISKLIVGGIAFLWLKF